MSFADAINETDAFELNHQELISKLNYVVEIEITITRLDPNFVDIRIRKHADIDGADTTIGDFSRMSFANSIIGRSKVSELLPEAYAMAILTVWGPEATVSDPEE